MAKQTDDNLTPDLLGEPKRRGRPPKAGGALTGAQRIEAYRHRKAVAGVKPIEIDFTERALLKDLLATAIKTGKIPPPYLATAGNLLDKLESH